MSVDVKVTVLVGGVGGARFLLGVQTPAAAGPVPRARSQDHELTAIVNIGDDVWMYGLRICPDLDTCMYTLGGGIDPERGWGQSRRDLARQGGTRRLRRASRTGSGSATATSPPTWCAPRCCDAGYPLSAGDRGAVPRWHPARGCCRPATTASRPTSSSTDPRRRRDSGRSTSRSGGCATGRRCRRTASRSSAPRRPPPAPASLDAIAEADVVLLAPSNPVVSIGTILAVPGIRGALRSTAARVVGYSPIVGGQAAARHGRRVPVGDRRGEHRRRRSAATTAPRSGVGILDGWLVHEGDRAEIAGRRGAGGAAADDRPGDDRRDGARRTRSGRCAGQAVTEHGVRRRGSNCFRCPGCRSSGPGDDLAAAIAAAAPWLRDDDVVVVTSKVVSKCEGRLVAAPADPEERDALRRKLIDAEAVRVLARKGRTLITENALGLVQAAAGVDGSNVGSDELALLPVDPDASAAALRAGLRERLGRDRRRGRHRHHGPGLAQRPDRLRHRRRRADRAARLRRIATTGTATSCRHRGRRRRRDRRGRRPGQGQADRRPGGGGARTDAARQRIQCPDAAAARRGGPVLAGHRGGACAGPQRRPSCCADRSAGSATSRSRRSSSRPPSRKRSPRPRRTTPGRCGSSGCRHRQARLLDRDEGPVAMPT